ncbi:hypothetical protein GCM10027194_11890 [Thalassiella azotivora]
MGCWVHELEFAGHAVGERRVWRLCSEQKLWSATVRIGMRGAGKVAGPAAHDDHDQRGFTPSAPDRGSPTPSLRSSQAEHPTGEGKLYCCAISDLVSNESSVTRSTSG